MSTSSTAPTPQSLSIQKDIMYFKDDVLNSIKQMNNKLNLKYAETTENIQSQLSSYDSKINALSSQIVSLSNLISKDKSIDDKIESLTLFKSQTESTLTTLQVRETLLTKQLSDAIYKYDKAIVDNLLLPGIIGSNCKYKSFREFTDFILTQISQFTTFKDKQIFDLESYKTKIESISKSLSSQVNTLNTSVMNSTNESIKESEKRIKDLLQIYNDRLEDMRVENSKYIIDTKTQFNKMLNEWKNMSNIRDEIYTRFDNEVGNIIEKNKHLLNVFDDYKKEFKLIKNRFTQLSDFIRDIRFRLNGGNVNRKDAYQMSNAINFNKRQTLDKKGNYNRFVKNLKRSNFAESFLKKYISGEVDLGTIMEPRRNRKHTEHFNQNEIIHKESEGKVLSVSNSSSDMKGRNSNIMGGFVKLILGKDRNHSSEDVGNASNRYTNNNNNSGRSNNINVNENGKEHIIEEESPGMSLYNHTSIIHTNNNSDNILNQNVNTHPKQKIQTRNDKQMNKTISEQSIHNDNNKHLSLGTTNIKTSTNEQNVNPKQSNNQIKTQYNPSHSDTQYKHNNAHKRANSSNAYCDNKNEFISSKKYIEFPSPNNVQMPVINQQKKYKEIVNKIKEEAPNDNFIFYHSSNENGLQPLGFKQVGNLPIFVPKTQTALKTKSINIIKNKKVININNNNNNSNTNNNNKTQQLQINQNQMSNNFYYNLMVNEDMTAKNESKKEKSF